jgi:uncharacterized protein (DUF1330 family)
VPIFVITTAKIKDPAKFAEYTERVRGMNAKFGGELIVRGYVDEVLEGESEAGELVGVARFEDIADVHAMISSPENQAAKRLREGVADVTMRVVTS